MYVFSTKTVLEISWWIGVEHINCPYCPYEVKWLLQTGWPGFNSQQGHRYLFATVSRPILGPTQPPVQGVLGALFLGVKLLGHEVYCSLPSSTKIKNVWCHTSTPPYIYMAWCIIKHKENFTFTLFLTSLLWLWKFHILNRNIPLIRLVICIIVTTALHLKFIIVLWVPFLRWIPNTIHKHSHFILQDTRPCYFLYSSIYKVVSTAAVNVETRSRHSLFHVIVPGFVHHIGML
jgi:hypothetical protein